MKPTTASMLTLLAKIVARLGGRLLTGQNSSATTTKSAFASTPIAVFRKSANAEQTRKFWNALGYEAHVAEKGMVTLLLSKYAALFFLSPESEHFAKFSEDIGNEVVHLIMENQSQVDKMHGMALANGGEDGELFKDETGYARCFVDPDGHFWAITAHLGDSQDMTK